MELLLIEDNIADAELFRISISEAPFDYPRITVKICHSLAEAQVALAEKAYQLILLDIFLPDAVELEGLKFLSKLHPETAIIIYSAHYSQDFASKAIAHGAQDYIIKGTLSSEDLVRTLFHAKLRQENTLKLRLIGEQDIL